MIFVTVGTQLPFDRLVKTVDEWASVRPYADAFAQIGPAKYRPKSMPFAEFLDADECRKKTEQADVVVAHAGMGSILTALELGRPVLVMPRLAALGEHRNDHQLATAKKLLAQGRIFVAFDETELLEKLEFLNKYQATERLPVCACPSLLSTLRSFVNGQKLELPLVEGKLQVDPLNLVDVEHKQTKHRSNLQPLRPALVAISGMPGHQADVWDGSVGDDLLGEPQKWGNRGVDLADRFDSPLRSQAATQTIKSRLASVILLAGRLRTTDLAKRIGRSRLDLPVDATRSLLAHWRDEVAQLGEKWGCDNLPIRVLLDRLAPTPMLPPVIPGVPLSVERDRSEYRGTGGILRDACSIYDDEAWVLVANAAQLLFEELHQIVERLAAAGGEINVVNENDGIPNGLILLKCGVLRAISDIGFHDMKEQVVPAMARQRLVKVVSSHGVTSPPIHSLHDYTVALRRYHGKNTDNRSVAGEKNERWQSRFSIREKGSVVAPSAVIHDSVVLEGAAVEREAVVVRSVVGRGARIGPGQIVVDQVVSGTN
ncbi:MAG TPA: glycosyltransferase [Tepidisphaeraceae bacterium]|jgi:UDP-N-acetylglucosamine transferase subunit ALG13|nr:glycosyltransferase [Tepidisphaeraceae bacterium]